jgi:probable F420-dependent oxidoreductase
VKLDTQVFAPWGAAQRAAELAAAGFHGVFTFEGPHDPFPPLVLAAAAGLDLDLYTNVAIALPRNPMQLAHLARDLHDLSGGRFALGLGSQTKAQVERRYGVPFDPPVARMRELVAALRAIFASWQDGARLDFRGDFYTHTLMPPLFNPGPSPHGAPPIWLGALGPHMTAMTAEVADGLLVMPFHTRRSLDELTRPNLERGLARAGRAATDVTVVCEAIICTGRDEAELAVAEAGARGLVAFYGATPAYRPVLEVHGWGELQTELHGLSKQGRWSEMASLVDDEVLGALAIRGTPAEVAAEVAGRYGGFADRVAVYFPYSAPDDLITDVAGAVAGATSSEVRA